ncbi:MAG: hypothetical protein A4E65_02792 [Syntrophorhabdus sp. PtaU1.Bin153]|nr:MAG: hypothetical protein A4E65_02792 [Syntrophorhabdus sp. PtaU1.Bin153]
MACLKHNINYGIGLECVYNAGHLGKTAGVGRHTGAGYLEITFSKGLYRVIRILFNIRRIGLESRAGIKGDDDAPRLFDNIENLLGISCDRAACHKDTRRSIRPVHVSGFPAFLQFFDCFAEYGLHFCPVYPLGQECQVVHLLPAHNRRIKGRKLNGLPHHCVFSVRILDGVLDLFIRCTDIECGLKEFLEFPYHHRPIGDGFLFVGQLRQVHDVCRFPIHYQLEHLLFAVAGCFTYYCVGYTVERAGIRNDETVARFDKRA